MLRFLRCVPQLCATSGCRSRPFPRRLLPSTLLIVLQGCTRGRELAQRSNCMAWREYKRCNFTDAKEPRANPSTSGFAGRGGRLQRAAPGDHWTAIRAGRQRTLRETAQAEFNKKLKIRFRFAVILTQFLVWGKVCKLCLKMRFPPNQHFQNRGPEQKLNFLKCSGGQSRCGKFHPKQSYFSDKLGLTHTTRLYAAPCAREFTVLCPVHSRHCTATLGGYQRNWPLQDSRSCHLFCGNCKASLDPKLQIASKACY
jgi:hypothetical protein